MIKFLSLPSLSYDIIIDTDIIKTLINKIGADHIFSPRKNSDIKPNCNIIQDFNDAMEDQIDGTLVNKLPEFRIDMEKAPPITTPRFRLGKPWEDLIETKVKKLLENGIIRRSPTVIVNKKDGSKRLCIDYRKIKDVTVKDAYPLPRINDILNALSEVTIYSILDATSEHHQIPVSETDP